jgi:hypothetical protein
MEVFDCKLRVQQSLMNLTLVNDLLTMWSAFNRAALDSKHQIDAILAVHAVAIRSVTAICENGKIEGIEGLNNLTSPDILTEFAVHPKKFHEFSFQHWDAYSSNSLFTCSNGQ